jgi:hypothetical protein
MPQITANEASAAYAKQTLTEHGMPIAQIVLAATNPGDAARQLAEVQALADRCQAFSAAKADGVNVAGAVAATAIPGLGDRALDVRVTATGPDAATYQQPELILVRVGDKLAAISDNYPGGGDSSARKEPRRSSPTASPANPSSPRRHDRAVAPPGLSHSHQPFVQELPCPPRSLPVPPSSVL